MTDEVQWSPLYYGTHKYWEGVLPIPNSTKVVSCVCPECVYAVMFLRSDMEKRLRDTRQAEMDKTVTKE